MSKTIIKFWREGCINCRGLAPILEEVKKEHSDIEFKEINSNTDEAEPYKITSLPTLVFLKDGTEVARMMGLKPKSLIAKKIAEVF